MASMSTAKRPSFRAEPVLLRVIEEQMKVHGVEKQSDYLRGLIILDKAREKNSLAIGVPVTIPGWVMHEFPSYFSLPSRANVEAEVLKDMQREENIKNRSSTQHDERHNKRKSA